MDKDNIVNEEELITDEEDIVVIEDSGFFGVSISKEDAEKLTQDIQSTTTALYVLLKKAHDTKAWMSLGYKSWTEYIEEEFDFSRARSYQLINQANVIEEINSASGVPLYITEREARDIKKRLPEITEQLKKDVKDAGLEGDEAENKVFEILEEEDSASGVDNANNYTGTKDGWDDPEEEFDKGEDSSPGYSDGGYSGGHVLSEEDKFYYENLLVTLKIFESMPNATLLGEKISKSGENKKDLIKLAESSFAWITKLLDELE